MSVSYIRFERSSQLLGCKMIYSVILMFRAHRVRVPNSKRIANHLPETIRSESEQYCRKNCHRFDKGPSRAAHWPLRSIKAHKRNQRRTMNKQQSARRRKLTCTQSRKLPPRIEMTGQNNSPCRVIQMRVARLIRQIEHILAPPQIPMQQRLGLKHLLKSLPVFQQQVLFVAAVV